jgi:hypothetical protein
MANFRPTPCTLCGGSGYVHDGDGWMQRCTCNAVIIYHDNISTIKEPRELIAELRARIEQLEARVAELERQPSQ